MLVSCDGGSSAHQAAASSWSWNIDCLGLTWLDCRDWTLPTFANLQNSATKSCLESRPEMSSQGIQVQLAFVRRTVRSSWKNCLPAVYMECRYSAAYRCATFWQCRIWFNYWVCPTHSWTGVGLGTWQRLWEQAARGCKDEGHGAVSFLCDSGLQSLSVPSNCWEDVLAQTIGWCLNVLQEKSESKDVWLVGFNFAARLASR